MTLPNLNGRLDLNLENIDDFNKYIGRKIVEYPDAKCYCPKCGTHTFGLITQLRNRNDVINLINYKKSCKFDNYGYEFDASIVESTYYGNSVVLIHTCRQCGSENIIIHHSVNGSEIISTVRSIQSSVIEGVPDVVSFYFNQAQKSMDSQIYCASMAMFRSCLESILIDQKINGDDLFSKINNLDPTVHPWVRDLDVDYMDVIRLLGNFSVHPKDNDIEKIRQIDSDTVYIVKNTILQLIQKIYLEPKKRQQELSDLKEKISKQKLFKGV